jgi:hypothetical protein
MNGVRRPEERRRLGAGASREGVCVDEEQLETVWLLARGGKVGNVGLLLLIYTLEGVVTAVDVT